MDMSTPSRSRTWLRAIAVPALVLVLGLMAIGAITLLQVRSTASRDAAAQARDGQARAQRAPDRAVPGPQAARAAHPRQHARLIHREQGRDRQPTLAALDRESPRRQLCAGPPPVAGQLRRDRRPSTPSAPPRPATAVKPTSWRAWRAGPPAPPRACSTPPKSVGTTTVPRHRAQLQADVRLGRADPLAPGRVRTALPAGRRASPRRSPNASWPRTEPARGQPQEAFHDSLTGLLNRRALVN